MRKSIHFYLSLLLLFLVISSAQLFSQVPWKPFNVTLPYLKYLHVRDDAPFGKPSYTGGDTIVNPNIRAFTYIMIGASVEVTLFDIKMFKKRLRWGDLSKLDASIGAPLIADIEIRYGGFIYFGMSDDFDIGFRATNTLLSLGSYKTSLLDGHFRYKNFVADLGIGKSRITKDFHEKTGASYWATQKVSIKYIFQEKENNSTWGHRKYIGLDIGLYKKPGIVVVNYEGQNSYSDIRISYGYFFNDN